MNILIPLLLLSQVQVATGDPEGITQAILNEIRSQHGALHGPIFIGAEQTLDALRQQAFPAMPRQLDLSQVALPGIRIEAAAEEDVVACDEGVPHVRSGRCSIRGDGFFVSIVEAQRVESSREILANVRVLWTDEAGMLLGYTMQMYLAPDPSDPAEAEPSWEVVRIGTVAVR